MSVLVKDELFICWHENDYRYSTILVWELISFPHPYWLPGMYVPVYSAMQRANENFFPKEYFMLLMEQFTEMTA